MKRTIFILIFLNILSSITSIGQPSIIVIGAGPSGIAAATKLLKHGFQDVIILEAENRIGGRVFSVKVGDEFVDLGAEWCHGEKDNIVYNMMKKYDVLKHTNTTFTLFYSNGEVIEEDVFNNLMDFTDSLVTSNSAVEKNCKNISSVGECFDILFKPTFEKKYQNSTSKLKLSVDSFNWLKLLRLGHDSAFSLNDLSLTTEYKECEGDILMNWNGYGYKTVLDLMMQKFPNPNDTLPIDKSIFFNKEVTKIIWRRDIANKTVIRCYDNTSFEADHVIFTPSLGVLKASYKEMFEPKLPEEKIKAIQDRGIGAIMKIALHFPKKWWNNTIFGFIWSAEDEINLLSEFPRGPVKDGKHWLTSLVALVPTNDRSGTLMGFFAGDMVPELEKQTDEVLLDGCMYALRKHLEKKYSIGTPDHMVRSSWYSNSHFRGTYSYEQAGKDNEGNKFPEKLGSPLKNGNGNPAVLFAGEATHPYYFSTVHGAIETGYREANRIINLYSEEQ